MFRMIGPVEVLLLYVIWLVAIVVGLYWVIRLGVRHGVMDARRRSPERPPASTP